jgi:hypothetical protein
MLLFAALAALHVPSAGWKRTLGRIRLVFTSCNSAWRIASYFVDVYPLYLYFAERKLPPYLLRGAATSKLRRGSLERGVSERAGSA